MKIEIDNKAYDFNQNETILDVCRKNNIEIPTLCFLKEICHEANCRICMVEVNGRLMPSCSTLAQQDMKVITKNAKVFNSRKKTLEMLVSNHHKDCVNCQKYGYCTLNKLFMQYNVTESKEFYKKNSTQIDDSSPCITRNNNKCILCNRCQKICTQTQSVSALTKQERGFETFMGCAYNNGLRDSTCVGCGQCTLVCPTGALVEKDETKLLTQMLSEKENILIAQVAPSVRVSLAEAFGENIGTFDEGRMVSALKKLGFKYVFDINLGADFTVVEESNELLENIKNNKKGPLFSSCCPAWFKFLQNFYPDYVNNLSSCKSPTEMLGAIIKNYYAQSQNIDVNKIKVVGIMPCTAKKGEKERGEDVDLSLTTRELARLIKQKNIDYLNLPHEKFDSPLSTYSGAGLIFGATGGVTEAVLRRTIKLLNPQSNQIEFLDVRQGKGRKEVDVCLGETKLKLCVVSGLKNARELMEDIKSGKKEYDFVEVMACPGGCVNGGGQINVDYDKIDIEEVKFKRANSLYEQDKKLKVRNSSDNEIVQQIYRDFFIPSPNKCDILHYHK